MSIESTSGAYTALANNMMDAALGTQSFGPILRQPVPNDPDQLTLLHWLFAAKGDIPIPRVVLDLVASATDGVLVIPAAEGGRFTQRVFQVYPVSSSLLFANPLSSVIGGGAILLTEDDWEIEGNRTLIRHPDITAGQWKIVYTHGGTEEVVKRGDGYEAWPVWTRIPRGYAACAPDTFRWFDRAATEAIELDKRAGRADRWTKLRQAVRRTALRGQDITDLRDVFQPLPGMDAFDLDGMFSYSDHPLAEPPPAPRRSVLEATPRLKRHACGGLT